MEAEEKVRKEAEEKYYNEHFEEIMVKKIDNYEDLTKRELHMLSEYAIDDEYGENRRWTRSVTSILKLQGRYFRLNWEEGLTKYQENEYFEQPVEVEKKEYQKTITVTEWVDKV